MKPLHIKQMKPLHIKWQYLYEPRENQLAYSIPHSRAPIIVFLGQIFTIKDIIHQRVKTNENNWL